MSEHRPALDAQSLPQSLAILDQDVLCNRLLFADRIGTQDTTLIEGDQPQCPAEQTRLPSGELMTAKSWSAVQVQQSDPVGLSADVDE